MTQTPHPLDAAQLELLFDLRNVRVLRALRTPDTASGVARTLELPPNLAHYRINRLLAAGLLRVESDNGRGRVYRTVHETFTVPKELVGELGETLPGMLEALLNRVYRAFFAELERMSLDLGTLDADGDAVTVDLERNLGVSGEGDKERFRYVPRAAVTEVSVTEGRYEELAETLRRTISGAADEASGERCTFAVLSFRGGSLR